MKLLKYLFFVFIALTVVLSSCKKDDENSSELIGNWAESPSQEQFIYVFNANGQGTFKVKNCETGKTLETETFTYTFDSKTTKITLSGGGEINYAYIKFISKTSIQFYTDAEYTDDASEVLYKQ